MSALLSILSGVTLGQAHIVKGLLEESIEKRIKDTDDNREVIQTQDVLCTIQAIYEVASLLIQKVKNISS
jgi:hypothetical protein